MKKKLNLGEVSHSFWGIAHLHLYAPVARTWTATWASHSVSTWLLPGHSGCKAFQQRSNSMSSSMCWSVPNGNEQVYNTDYLVTWYIYTLYNLFRKNLDPLFVLEMHLSITESAEIWAWEFILQIVNKWHVRHIHSFANQPKAAAFFLESSACTTCSPNLSNHSVSILHTHIPQERLPSRRTWKGHGPQHVQKSWAKASKAPTLTVSIDFCSSELRALGASWLIIC